MNIQHLKNAHQGETVFVIASGASLAQVSRKFFSDKVTVVINEAFRDWPTDYAFSHHHENMQEAIDRGCCVVVSEHQFGQTKFGACKFDGDYFTYKHAEQGAPADPVDLTPLVTRNPTTLISTPCTVAEALHFAVHLGAQSIVTCGVDRGALNGQWNYPQYNSYGIPPASGIPPYATAHGGTNPDHILAVDALLQRVIDTVRGMGIGVYGLSPFVGVKQEGHRV